MNPEDQNLAACWSFQHNQMEEADREAFSRRLEEDADLRLLLAKVQAIDALLNEAGEEEASALQAELDSLMQEFDAEQAEDNKVIPFNSAWSKGAFALAACLIIFIVSVPSVFGPQVAWDKPVIGVIEFRGDEAPALPAFSNADVVAVHAQLRLVLTQKIEAAQEAEQLPRFKARIKTGYSPAAQGALVFEIQVLDKELSVFHWSGDYASLDRLKADIDRISEKVLNGLKGK